MAKKYDQEIKDKAVEMAKSGKRLSEISKELGPGVKAIQRYCQSAGVVVKKAIRAKKEEQPDIL